MSHQEMFRISLKFMGKFWKALYKSLGTKLTPSSPYRPQTDGQTERMNSTFTEAVRAFVNAKMRAVTQNSIISRPEQLQNTILNLL